MTSIRRIFLVLTLALTTCAGAVYAQNTRSQENKKARLEKEIAQLDKQLKDVKSKSSSALSSLGLIQKKVASRRQLVAESDREIKQIAGQITAKQKEIDRIQDRLDTLTTYYSRLVQNAYRNRDPKVWYMYILASDDLGQAYRRMGYLRGLSSQMNVQARKISATKAELEAETAKLNTAKAEAQQLRNERVKEMKALKKDETDAQNLVSTLKKQQKKYQQELNAKKKQVEALNREIERIIRESSRKGKGGAKKPVDLTLDKEFAKNKGKLPWPADGPVVESFGQHNHPVFKQVKLPFNNGITLAVDPGTRVKAVFDGVVKQIVVMPGYNKCVLVQHGGYFSFYCKLGSVSVKTGDKVKTGQVLGVVDTIGGETQLHFQIWKETTPQNPENWLR